MRDDQGEVVRWWVVGRLSLSLGFDATAAEAMALRWGLNLLALKDCTR